MSVRGHRPRSFDHDEAVRLSADGMKVSEIAQSLGVSVNSIRRAISPTYAANQKQIARRHAEGKRTPCKGDCGRLVWNHYRSLRPSGYCQVCLGRLRNVPRHGTETEYSQGCRCDLCREAATEARRHRRLRAAAA